MNNSNTSYTPHLDILSLQRHCPAVDRLETGLQLLQTEPLPGAQPRVGEGGEGERLGGGEPVATGIQLGLLTGM